MKQLQVQQECNARRPWHSTSWSCLLLIWDKHQYFIVLFYSCYDETFFVNVFVVVWDTAAHLSSCKKNSDTIHFQLCYFFINSNIYCCQMLWITGVKINDVLYSLSLVLRSFYLCMWNAKFIFSEYFSCIFFLKSGKIPSFLYF